MRRIAGRCALAERLKNRLAPQGIEIVLDQFLLDHKPGGPAEGWPKWSAAQVQEAQRVVMIASPRWVDCFTGKEPPEAGAGAVRRADGLCFIVSGRKVPADWEKTHWAKWVHAVELGALNKAEDWELWARERHPALTRQHIEAFAVGLKGVPGSVAAALDTTSEAPSESVPPSEP